MRGMTNLVKRIVKLLVSLLIFAVDWSVARVRQVLGVVPHPSCVVLYYHGVEPHQKEQFTRQMGALYALAKPIRADSFGRLAAGQRYAAVTFDDGFVSVLDYALPALLTRGIPAAIFVPTGSLGGPAHWLAGNRGQTEMQQVLGIEALKALGRQSLITIGSHSVNHRRFVHLDSSTARKELEDSKAILEQLLQKEVLLFSFPHGEFTGEHLELAKAAGYRRVFGIYPKPASLREEEFVAGRFSADPEDWDIEFRLKVLGAYRWMASISSLQGRLPCPVSSDATD